MSTNDLAVCWLEAVTNAIGGLLGEFVFESGDVAPAAYTLPDPVFGSAFPPTGTRVNGVFAVTQILNVRPSPEFENDFWVTVGICLGTYDQSPDLLPAATLVKGSFPEILQVRYYAASSTENPEKFCFTLQVRI
jgi:hypothetical protein